MLLKNNADDSTSGTITAGGFTTTGTWTFDSSSGSGTVGITAIQPSTASFGDSNVMTYDIYDYKRQNRELWICNY